MPVLVGDDVLRREVAGRAELVLELLQEVEVEVRLAVGRTVERPGLRARLPASVICRLREEHRRGFLVLTVEGLGKFGDPVLGDVVDGAAQLLLEIRAARVLAARLSAAGLSVLHRRRERRAAPPEPAAEQ